MTRLTLLVLALAALIAIGCGGDDDDNGDSGASSSATQMETEPSVQDDAEEGDGGSGSGGGGGYSNEGGTLTRAAFIARADRVCADARVELGEDGRKIAALARRTQQGKLDPKDYFRESAKLIEESAEVGDEAVDKLEALPKPESGREALERYLAATREQVKYLSDQAAATARGDQAEIAKLNAQSNRTAARVQAAANDYGFKVCGGG